MTVRCIGALTVTEGIMLIVGTAMWLASRRAIDRGLAEGDAAASNPP